MTDHTLKTPVFGKRKEPHTIIIARGNDVRHFTVKPWIAALAGSVAAAAAIGYFAATTYLVIRDDLLSGAIARQARIQQSYEDRISALRTQVDRITSRQLLDQQLMESKVGELLARQEMLADRQGRFGPILDRITGKTPAAVPVPVPRPKDTQSSASGKSARLGWNKKTGRFVTASLFGNSGDMPDESAADRADRIFVTVNQSLRSIEKEQVERLRLLAAETERTADAVASALDSAGLKGVTEGYDREGVGGPLVPANSAAAFDIQVAELDAALSRLDNLKTVVSRYPLGSPAPGKPVSSSFGYRRDPILGTPALHAGIDFRATTGTSIRATGFGTVITAGWSGGYGRMVEIRHEDGFTTRFGHMSKILVKEGDIVRPGTIIGKVGSSGRSTGPHLHYEVRYKGKAVNPLRYLKTGRTISTLL